jgi:hypothetical protein
MCALDSELRNVRARRVRARRAQELHQLDSPLEVLGYLHQFHSRDKCGALSLALARVAMDRSGVVRAPLRVRRSS